MKKSSSEEYPGTFTHNLLFVIVWIRDYATLSC
jgi:hypothetical protein